MPEDHHAIVLASLAADALALGAHWIYDTRQIDEAIGRIESLRAPLTSSFHAGKQKGDLTHYGDQTVLLLRALATEGGFSLEAFARAWREMLAEYTGYRDQATKDTLQRFEAGWPPEDAGSASTDLGGAARIAPLVYRYRHDEAALVMAVRQQTAMTHQNERVVDSAAYWARVAFLVLQGNTPTEAMERIGRHHFDRPPFSDWIATGLASRDGDTRETIGAFGQACSVDGAFAGVVHLVAKYQDDPQQGLIANVMAGGDSAARGMLAGMIFGASCGLEAVAPDWVAEMNCLSTVEQDLQSLGPNHGTS